jgi:hypothetical protein
MEYIPNLSHGNPCYRFKADMLGKRIIFVDPCGTTQFCNKRLSWVAKELDDKEHICSKCREMIQRDVSSASLIKRLGILSYPP